jgi:Ca-activated chloride channel family protein
MSGARLTIPLIAIISLAGSLAAQSGKGEGGPRTAILNVIVRAPKDKIISKEAFDLYDSGVKQDVLSFEPVPTGSRIVLLVDNSQGLRAEAKDLQKAAMDVINELYQDDQMLVVGYNENAEIIQDMTPDLAKLQIATSKFTRKGFPKLFDALIAVSDALAKEGKGTTEKTAIVLITDGYDSESQTKFDQALYALQDNNVMLFAIQVPDRTHGALLRNKPKPPAVLERLTVGTGGAIYPLAPPGKAAKTIADDLRNNCYHLTYSPAGISTLGIHRLLIVSNDNQVEFRTKGSHPGRYRPPE